MYSPDLQSRIALWRQKSAEGTMSPDDYREAIAALREGRLAAASSSAKTKAKKPTVSGDDLLSELGDL